MSGRLAQAIWDTVRRSCLISLRAPVTKIVVEKDVSVEEFKGSDPIAICTAAMLRAPGVSINSRRSEGENAERASWIVSHRFSRDPRIHIGSRVRHYPPLYVMRYMVPAEAKVARPARDARLRNDPSREEVNLDGFSRSIQKTSIGEHM